VNLFWKETDLDILQDFIYNYYGYEGVPTDLPERKNPRKLKIRGLLWRGDFTLKNMSELENK